jgi:hypothetical protein
MQPVSYIGLSAGPLEAVRGFRRQAIALRRLTLHLQDQIANLTGVLIPQLDITVDTSFDATGLVEDISHVEHHPANVGDPSLANDVRPTYVFAHSRASPVTGATYMVKKSGFISG